MNQTQWLGGAGWPGDHLSAVDQWFPYWANGNVPLVELLRAAGAIDRLPTDLPLDVIVDGYMRHVLEQDVVGGWIRHNGSWSEAGALGEGGFEIVQALLQWGEAKSREERKRVATAVLAQLRSASGVITPQNIVSWTATRWPTFVFLVECVLDRLLPGFGDDPDVVPLGRDRTAALLIDAANRISQLGMDWNAYYQRLTPTNRTSNRLFPDGAVPIWNVYDHGVNNAEGALRWPAAMYRVNGSKAAGEAALAMVLEMLESKQGQVPRSRIDGDESTSRSHHTRRHPSPGEHAVLRGRGLLRTRPKSGHGDLRCRREHGIARAGVCHVWHPGAHGSGRASRVQLPPRRAHWRHVDARDAAATRTRPFS